MNKMQMAHEYVVAMLKTPAQLTGMGDKDIAVAAFNLAGAMQAEADKRNKAESEEWQPDWSQAPDGFNYFCVGSEGGYGFFSKQEPKLCGSYYFVGNDGFVCKNHSYQGNWQDSLRKRPQ